MQREEPNAVKRAISRSRSVIRPAKSAAPRDFNAPRAGYFCASAGAVDKDTVERCFESQLRWNSSENLTFTAPSELGAVNEPDSLPGASTAK